MALNQTFFEEAIDSPTDEDGVPAIRVPSYVIAADTLNIANRNMTFAESIVDTRDSIQKFIGVSLISGASQVYNIPASVGNLFGQDNELRDTAEVISTLDSDLGLFYEDHQQGADLVGFMLSSIVPGLGGVKILNAGQKAMTIAMKGQKMGSGMSRAMGLLLPDRANKLKVATEAVANNSSAAGIFNRNALKVIGAGAHQNALEALFFELGVTATLFDSPILENQDLGDFIFNVAMGAGVFGVFGAAIDGAVVKSALGKTANTAALEARPWTHIQESAKASSTYEALVLDIEQLHSMPVVPEGLDSTRTAFLNSAASSKVSLLEDRIKSNIHTLSKEDNAVAETINQLFKGTSPEDQLNTYMGLENISRMGHRTKDLTHMERMEREIAAGNIGLDDEDMIEFLQEGMMLSYVKVWGDGAHVVTQERPVITSLIDTIGVKDTIEVSEYAVKAGDQKYKFSARNNVGSIAGTGNAQHWNGLEKTVLETNARHIWAQELPKLDVLAAKQKSKIIEVHANDVPMLEKLLRDIPDAMNDPRVRIVGQDGTQPLAEGVGLRKFIENQKLFLANKLHDNSVALSTSNKGPLLKQEEIAAMVNVKTSLLSGEVRINAANDLLAESDIFAMQSYTSEYANLLKAQGMRAEKADALKIWNVPQNVRMLYDTNKYVPDSMPNHTTTNMAIIKEQQKLYQEGLDKASRYVLGDDVWGKLEPITSARVRRGAVPSGAGGGAFSAASNNYGTLAATVENIGGVTTRAIHEAKARARDALEPIFYKLANNQQAAIEWANLNATLRSIPGEYVLDDAGDALIPAAVKRYKEQLQTATNQGGPMPTPPVLTEGLPDSIPLVSQEVKDAAVAHIAVNGQRTQGLVAIRAAQGNQMNRSADAFYPIPVNPKDYKFFASVEDISVTSTGHTKTLYATSEEELAGMIAKLKGNPHLKVRTKRETERYFKAGGEWEYEKTLNANYLDTEALRKGVSAPYIISTDPAKITSDALSWHLQRETGMIREAVGAKYEVQFEELRRLGDEFTDVATSQFSDKSLLTYADEAIKNPYADYIKTALGVKKTENYPWWAKTNQMADTAVSTLLKKATAFRAASKSPEELLEIDRMLKQAGYKGAAYDADMELFANATVARGVLSTTVQKANSLLATIVLRLDSINAVNNAVSANVLLGAETAAVLRAIQAGDSEAVGALAALTRIKVPGTNETIFAPTKLIGNAIAKFGREGSDGPTMQFYRENGYVTSITDQYKDSLEQLTYTGRENVTDWASRVDGLAHKMGAFGDAGEKFTGNRLAEEFNRFVAADVMKQMTDVAVSRNLMTTKEQLAYINTFVNRTQGNYLASQRPVAFHGPIGQAMGLFQTYQFNLMQQLLRHAGEGHAKDAMTLLALQGTIHGMNGLPAFNAINTHIVGSASGNTKHRDAYDAMYGIVGKEAGDWLMYGAASNALGLLHPDLKINLYTRGDINPRHVTILPTNPSTVPIIQASGRFFANIFNTAKQLQAGGDVSTTLLQGLEHNAISRPLAGLAATLEGFNNPYRASYSTSSKGNVIAAADMLSWANLARVAGAKPMDEAIAIDASFRFKSYSLKDARKRQVLGKAIKSTVIAGGNPTNAQIEDFAQQYAEAGGKIEEFNSWFTQLYKTANASQANEISRSLSSPFTQAMQKIMGGRELKDFSTSRRSTASADDLEP